MRVIAKSLCVLLLPLVCGCVSEDYLEPRVAPRGVSSADAVGFVSASAPLFSPMDSPRGVADRLEFGDLKDEERILKYLSQSNFSAKSLEAESFRLQIAAKIASVVTDIRREELRRVNGGIPPESAVPPPANTTPAEGGASDEATDAPKTEVFREDRRTSEMQSPRPFDAQSFTLPGHDLLAAKGSDGQTLLARLVDLLAPDASTRPTHLAMDELVTHIASLKTYMVNLEEYHNVKGYDYARGHSNSYVPYRVQFTVTAEPGWFSKHGQHDAVCEVKFNLPPIECDDDPQCDACGNRVKVRMPIVLSATPAEVGQTMNEFAALVTQQAVQASLSVPIQDFAQVGANAERLRLVASQLQGMRIHKTLAVGFPSSNSVRIRFMAQRAADPRGHELQAVSRLITAIVLVPKRIANEKGEPVTLDARELARNDAELDLQTEHLATALRGFTCYGQQLRDDLHFAVQAFRSALGTPPHPPLANHLENATTLAGELAYEALAVTTKSVESPFPDTADVEEAKANVKDALKGLLLATPRLVREQFSPQLKQALAAASRAKNADATLLEAQALNFLEERWESAGQSDLNQLSNTEKKRMIWELEGDPLPGRADPSPGLDGASESAQTGMRLPVEGLLKAITEAFSRAYLGIGQIKIVASTFENSQAQTDWEMHRERVRRFLEGGACYFGVSGWYAPTVRDHRGRWNPPRNYLLRTYPVANRLVARVQCEQYTTPIPPWMGPLAEQPQVHDNDDESPKAFFSAASSVLTSAYRDAHVASRDVADLAALITRDKADPKYLALARAKANLSVAASLLKSKDLEYKQAKVKVTAEIAIIKHTVATYDEIIKKKEKGYEKVAKERMDLQLRILGLTESLNTKEAEKKTAEEAHGRAKKALTDASGKGGEALEQRVKANQQRLSSAQSLLKKRQEQLKASVPVALSIGHASVAFSYTAPSMLLDDRELTITRSDVWVRVVGLRQFDASKECKGETDGGEIPCSRTRPTQDEYGRLTLCTCPGEYCKLAPGHERQAVVRVENVDLGVAHVLDTTKALSPSESPIRAFIELVVVPHGMSPADGISHPAAKVATQSVVVYPRSKSEAQK